MAFVRWRGEYAVADGGPSGIPRCSILTSDDIGGGSMAFVRWRGEYAVVDGGPPGTPRRSILPSDDTAGEDQPRGEGRETGLGFGLLVHAN